MFEMFSMKDSSLAAMVADEHLALDCLLAREFCCPKRAACSVYVGYTGKVPLITQQVRQIK